MCDLPPEALAKNGLPPEALAKGGRSGGVRTHDLYVPNVALYQAELYSENKITIIPFVWIAKSFLSFFLLYRTYHAMP